VSNILILGNMPVQYVVITLAVMGMFNQYPTQNNTLEAFSLFSFLTLSPCCRMSSFSLLTSTAMEGSTSS